MIDPVLVSDFRLICSVALEYDLIPVIVSGPDGTPEHVDFYAENDGSLYTGRLSVDSLLKLKLKPEQLEEAMKIMAEEVQPVFFSYQHMNRIVQEQLDRMMGATPWLAKYLDDKEI